MDREQEELQFLGFFGIFKESFKIITSCKQIFTKITLSFILPLSFIFLAHLEISDLLFSKILHNEFALDRTQENSPKHHKISDVLTSEWTAFWLFKAAYFTFFLLLLLLSTAAVVYTVACIYTAKNLTFKNIISVVPKVWKRLLVTFVWNFIIVFCYNMVAFLLLVIWMILIGPNNPIGFAILILLSIIYLIGTVYISVVWHLASVVSVLEDIYGFRAMIKSKALIKGKLAISIGVFLVLTLSFLGIEYVFERYVVHGFFSSKYLTGIASGIICLSLLFMWILFGLVVQTVIYFVCKSYHHENIDKSALADHLEVYLGDYVPLKERDVQLEEFDI